MFVVDRKQFSKITKIYVLEHKNVF